MRDAALGAGGTATLVHDVDAAVSLLRTELEPGDVVLVKASRSVGLERVAAALLDEAVVDPSPGDESAGDRLAGSDTGFRA
jgi:UDP-N-acetylmuramoyl-tripeptide--D-alanyl-D-alanine ligase